MTIIARTLDEIQNTYLTALAALNSSLVIDSSEGSLAYALSRASAAIALLQDNRLLDLQTNALLLNAKGSALDTLLTGILTRTPASYARGSVLAITKTGSQTIYTGTTLVELTTGLQFNVTSSNSSVYNLVETALQVTASTAGASGNLPAGTALYSPTYSNICFHVGATHTDNYYGDLTGGVNPETDASLLQRFLQRVSQGATASVPNLQSYLLTHPLVNKAYVNTNVPGIVEIWLDGIATYTSSQLTEVLNYTQPYLAAGVVPVVLQVSRVPVNLNIAIIPYANSTDNLTELANRLTTLLANYINTLTLGQSLPLTAIVSLLSPLARSVSVVSPVTDITCQSNQILVLGGLNYTFPSSY